VWYYKGVIDIVVLVRMLFYLVNRVCICSNIEELFS